MAQLLQIDPAVCDQAPMSTPATTLVARAPEAVTGLQPLPVWYRTPVVVVPAAAAAFIVGNVLLMVPWSMF